MNNSTIGYIGILVVMLMMSAFFSATETAFTSLNRIRIKNLAKDGNKRAGQVLKLSENFDTVLSTILIGNNIVNIASASIATVLFVEYFGNLGVTISTIVMTILVLIFGEISPKSLAKDSPESFAMFAVPILQVLIVVLKPVNFLFMLWKKLLSKMFKVTNEQNMTEEELLTIVEEAENDGGIDLQDGELIRSAIEFNDLDADDILTHRVDVVAIDMNNPKEDIAKIFFETGFSRLPVYQGTIDHIIGFINHKDFTHYVANGSSSLSEIINPVVFITPNMKISKLLTLLQKRKSHIAVVSDEYGGTAGIVTLEDVIEELVGEIWDEHDEVIDEFVKIAEDKYRILGKANLGKMFDLFEMNDDFDVITVGGWIIEFLDRVPTIGETFNFENLTITITQADERHIMEINVVKNPTAE
ncbi:HlyC/CorC family transporter [Acetobacterium bakii]|uniref:Transporter n=1 Tax=Acetobacterium bakii TaxID=52689 RepID=A0A0L6TYL3_9FIRM|nr:hemolysin family protein [Acetobacterium bakii]KNZ40675.1 transporter [Acetobacterium bakii]